MRRSVQTGGLQDAHRFEHDRRADAVVGGAGGAVPRVEVGAEHHDLVGLVGARQLGEDVEPGLIVENVFLHVSSTVTGTFLSSVRAIRP